MRLLGPALVTIFIGQIEYDAVRMDDVVHQTSTPLQQLLLNHSIPHQPIFPLPLPYVRGFS